MSASIGSKAYDIQAGQLAELGLDPFLDCSAAVDPIPRCLPRKAAMASLPARNRALHKGRRNFQRAAIGSDRIMVLS